MNAARPCSADWNIELHTIVTVPVSQRQLSSWNDSKTYCALRIFTWCSLSSKTQRLNGILSTYCQNHFPHSLPWNDTCKETCDSTTFHPHFFGLFRSFPSIFLSNPGHLQSPRSKWGRHSSGRSIYNYSYTKIICMCMYIVLHKS